VALNHGMKNQVVRDVWFRILGALERNWRVQAVCLSLFFGKWVCLMLRKAIETIEEEIADLKDRVVREINHIYAYLSRSRSKIKLRPRMVQHEGYSTFLIVWQRLVFYDFANRRAKLKGIRKGPTHQVPKSRLLASCHRCESWETEYIWEKEQGFARVRKQVALLSRGLKALKQCGAMEEGYGPEEGPVSSAEGMGMQEIVTTLAAAFENLKEHARQEVAAVIARLGEDGRTGLKPRVEKLKAGQFSVEWFKPNGSGSATGQPTERQIPREGKYSIRRTRLLAHCRDCEDWEKDFVWEKELEFARVRKQAGLLVQAISALKQYTRERESEGRGKGR
jgi:MobI protein